MKGNYLFVTPGLPHELASLTLDDVLAHLKNYMGNFLLDGVVCSKYIARFLEDEQTGKSPEAVFRLRHLVQKYLQHCPFETSGLDIGSQIGLEEAPALSQRRDLLHKIKSDAVMAKRVAGLLDQDREEKALALLLGMLRTHPGDIWAADMLLGFAARQRDAQPEWLPRFHCPAPLRDLWNTHLFNFYAGLNSTDNALALWPELEEKALDEITLNRAAEIWLKAGDKDKSCALYLLSLRKDPSQTPVRLRLEELQNPTAKDASLPGEKNVQIYIYSYNKGTLLGKTLESLSATNIGRAKVKVLLNGCTDDSLTIVEQTRGMFPNGLDIVSLPVNVGAPAARNWLVADPATREADYVAFLDDDVELPPGWLEYFLTVMENRPRAGVAGCKVVAPGEPPNLQYLYRTPAVAKEDLIRLSLSTPSFSVDTNTYDFVRDTANVMGCCHLFRTGPLLDVPNFDLCFSPSQMDDIAHDLEMRLKGHGVVYCGLVKCIHHQCSGVAFKGKEDNYRFGNVMGNDVKFYYKFCDRVEELRKLMNT